jgi:hypothetical protein
MQAKIPGSDRTPHQRLEKAAKSPGARCEQNDLHGCAGQRSRGLEEVVPEEYRIIVVRSH